jgi:putative transposase
VLAELSLHAASACLTDSQRVYAELVRWIGDACQRENVAVHGWVLTPGAIALIATPGDQHGLPRMVQSLGRHLATRLKTGSVFKGRYHSTILEPGYWLIPALIWLEWLPVRASLVSDPELWPWSSAAAHTGSSGITPGWLAHHIDYWACGNTPFDRQAIYRTLLQNGNAGTTDQRISQSLRGQWALGREAFLAALAQISSRRVLPGLRGRPKKSTVLDQS